MIDRLKKFYACYRSHRLSGHGRMASARIAARHHKFTKGTP